MKRFQPKLKNKRWDIKEEEELLKKWIEENVYTPKWDKNKPTFSIDTPPPYASGIWHIAAAAHYVQFDFFTRYFRMKGYNIYFPMGIDRNGLPIEIRVEKEYNIKAREIDRETFLELCSKKLDEYEKYILDVVRRMGMTTNYLNPYRTDSPEYRALTQATFIELWKHGLVYEDSRPTIWCPDCYTPIAEAEVEYVKRKGKLYYIKFPFKEDPSKYVVIATTRPELIGATAAILYHPDDERFKGLENKEVLIPMYEYSVKIISHPVVNPEYGSGMMMLSSFGDLEDVRLFREFNLKPRILISPDGTMNELSGKYTGLKPEEARIEIAKDLEKERYILKTEWIDQNIPTCWRSKNPVEFIFVKALYLKQLEYKKTLLKLIDEINFIPDFHKQLLINWINSISIDWAISRDRFYGTEVPIWYCKKCRHPHIPEPGRYYRPWKEKAPFSKCEKCGYTEFEGDLRTFDTWMDSSISCLYISKYKRNNEFFEEVFPVTLRPQGIDIVRTWLYYTLLRVYQLTNKPAFKYVRLSGMGLDEKGRPMSKSLGNIVEPIPIIDKYGADAFRLWAAGETKIGYNYLYKEDKIISARNFITKLWNIARFISNFPDISKSISLKDLTLVDKYLLLRLNNLIRLADKEFSNLDSFETIRELRHFVWEIFASHYLEMVKSRLYNSDSIFGEKEVASAMATIHLALKTILKIIHPITPFVTDYIWRELYGGNILNQTFPEAFELDIDNEVFGEIMLFNSMIWKYKEKNGLKKKDYISKVVAPSILKPAYSDLKAMHRIIQLDFSDQIMNVEDSVIQI